MSRVFSNTPWTWFCKINVNISKGDDGFDCAGLLLRPFFEGELDVNYGSEMTLLRSVKCRAEALGHAACSMGTQCGSSLLI